jgi:archaellum component FlaC
LSFKCDICGKTFKTIQALKSHISYAHKRAKKIKDITTTPTPPEIQQDPEILELRKMLEKRKLEKQLEEMENTPKIIDLAERVTKIEENMKKILDYQAESNQTLATLSSKIIELENRIKTLEDKMEFIGITYPFLIGSSNKPEKWKDDMLDIYERVFPEEAKALIEAMKREKG